MKPSQADHDAGPFMKNMVSKIKPMMKGRAGGGGLLGRKPDMITNINNTGMPDNPDLGGN